MTVQMTMEEYKELEKASEDLKAITDVVNEIKNSANHMIRVEKTYNLLNALGITNMEVGGYI